MSSEIIIALLSLVGTLAARDRSRAKKQAETLKRYELMGRYFTEGT